MPWRTAIINALRGTGTAPPSTRIGLAVVGGAVVLGTCYVALEVLRGSELSEMALILFAMLLLSGMALIQAGKNVNQISDRGAHGVDTTNGADRVDEGSGADERPDSGRGTRGRQ